MRSSVLAYGVGRARFEGHHRRRAAVTRSFMCVRMSLAALLYILGASSTTRIVVIALTP
jgi:hypothetical protein